MRSNGDDIGRSSKPDTSEDTEIWTLISDTATGALTVEHEWSYVDPFGQGKPDCGVSTVTVENFLTGGADDNVKQKLRAILVSSRNS